jgi:hypothetical protein
MTIVSEEQLNCLSKAGQAICSGGSAGFLTGPDQFAPLRPDESAGSVEAVMNGESKT